ncbi:arylesterase [Pseudochryseolinea flava]|uniref:Arylesterase n=2 Tax=Pseudochryseolinea flava TaxID=2059302 RepID=A0A364Y096_9BACT|nr:arylesterase [Pseudochryseolinea flava]
MVANKFLFIVLAVLFQASNTQKVILFYGDSLTAGMGVSSDEAFPALVGKKLNASGKPVKIINAGLSGETSAGGLSRLDWVLRQPIDVFVLELGPNDGLRGLPLAQTKKNLQAIIDKVKTKYPKVKIVVAGMMVPPNMGPDYTAEFKTMYPEIAKKNNAALIPFLLQNVAGHEKLNQDDGIHPNTEGHKIVAQTVYNTIAPLL